MRSGTYAIVFILVLILAVPTNLVDANNEIEVARVPDTSAEISPNITITGYVADVSNNEWNQALPDVTVSLLDSSMIRVSSTVTDENGMFKFTYPEGRGAYLMFEHVGYTLRTLPSTLVDMSESGYPGVVRIVLDQDLLVNGTYVLSSTATGRSPVGMSITVWDIYGYVQGNLGEETVPLSGAKVILVSEEGGSREATTDDKGYFLFDGCLYGKYTINVSCRGFNTVGPIDIETSAVAEMFTLDIKDNSVLGDLDAAHTMEIAGALLAGTVCLMAAFLYRRSRDKDSDIEFINEADNEDDVKEP